MNRSTSRKHNDKMILATVIKAIKEIAIQLHDCTLHSSQQGPFHLFTHVLIIPKTFKSDKYYSRAFTCSL